MLPVLCVLLVLFAPLMQVHHAQVRKIDTAEPRVFSLLSRIRDPLWQPKLRVPGRAHHCEQNFAQRFSIPA
jgi:hypothetical protein